MENSGTPPRDPNAPSDAQQVRIEMDASNVPALYANMCSVTHTPEEVILDLALNPNPLGTGTQRVKVTQRVVLNYYNAKRLAALLTATVQRHEQAFGRLETDIRKRLVGESKEGG